MENQEKQTKAILNEIQEIGFSEIKQEINETLNKYDLVTHYIDTLITDTRKSFISDLRTKYNIHNINMDSQKERELKELIDKEDKLSIIEDKIKLYFSQFSKDSKIKEIIREGFNIAIAKILKPNNERFYSYTNINKDYPNKQELFKLIQEKTDKYIIFSKWNLKDTYSRNEDLRKFQKLLNLFDIKIEIANYNDNLLEYETKINESNKDIKVKLYLNGKICLNIKDKAKHNQVRDYILNETLDNRY